MIKVAAVTGESLVRDVTLLSVLYGTGLMFTEVASVTVRDYAKEDGSIRKVSLLRATFAYNSKDRPLYWVNPKVTRAIDAYLHLRIQLKHGTTVRHAAFRGLDPDARLFRRADGEAYRLTARKAGSGTISYSCDSLSQVFRRLPMTPAHRVRPDL